MALCPECGSDLKPGARFCAHCGHQMPDEVEPPPEPEPASSSESKSRPPETEPTAPAVPPGPPGPPQQTRQPSNRFWAGLILGAVAVVVLIAIIVANVGGSDGGNAGPAIPTSAPAGQQDDEAAQETPTSELTALGRGEIAVYFTSGTGSESEYIAEYDITLESSSGAVFRYLPSRDELTIVDTYTSASYASLISFPLTIDGRLFLLDHGRETFNTDLYELDVATHDHLDPPGRFWMDYSGSSPTGYSVIDDRVMWRRPYDYDVMYGNTGGEIYVRYFGGEQQEVLDSDDPANQGELHTAGGRVYRVHLDSESYSLWAANADPATGARLDTLVSLDLAPIGAENWHFAVDAEALWLVCTVDGEGTGSPARVMLFRAPWGGAGADLVFETNLADDQDWVIALDADSGVVLMGLSGWSDESFIIYDHRAGSGTIYSLGMYPIYSQILVAR
jgi:hypothetical protein